MKVSKIDVMPEFDHTMGVASFRFNYRAGSNQAMMSLKDKSVAVVGGFESYRLDIVRRFDSEGAFPADFKNIENLRIRMNTEGVFDSVVYVIDKNHIDLKGEILDLAAEFPQVSFLVVCDMEFTLNEISQLLHGINNIKIILKESDIVKAIKNLSINRGKYLGSSMGKKEVAKDLTGLNQGKYVHWEDEVLKVVGELEKEHFIDGWAKKVLVNGLNQLEKEDAGLSAGLIEGLKKHSKRFHEELVEINRSDNSISEKEAAIIFCSAFIQIKFRLSSKYRLRARKIFNGELIIFGLEKMWTTQTKGLKNILGHIEIIKKNLIDILSEDNAMLGFDSGDMAMDGDGGGLGGRVRENLKVISKDVLGWMKKELEFYKSEELVLKHYIESDLVDLIMQGVDATSDEIQWRVMNFATEFAIASSQTQTLKKCATLYFLAYLQLKYFFDEEMRVLIAAHLNEDYGAPQEILKYLRASGASDASKVFSALLKDIQIFEEEIINQSEFQEKINLKGKNIAILGGFRSGGDVTSDVLKHFGAGVKRFQLPMELGKDIVKGYKCDLMLYVMRDNYVENKKKVIERFNKKFPHIPIVVQYESEKTYEIIRGLDNINNLRIVSATKKIQDPIMALLRGEKTLGLLELEDIYSDKKGYLESEALGSVEIRAESKITKKRQIDTISERQVTTNEKGSLEDRIKKVFLEIVGEGYEMVNSEDPLYFGLRDFLKDGMPNQFEGEFIDNLGRYSKSVYDVINKSNNPNFGLTRRYVVSLFCSAYIQIKYDVDVKYRQKIMKYFQVRENDLMLVVRDYINETLGQEDLLKVTEMIKEANFIKENFIASVLDKAMLNFTKKRIAIIDSVLDHDEGWVTELKGKDASVDIFEGANKYDLEGQPAPDWIIINLDSEGSIGGIKQRVKDLHLMFRDAKFVIRVETLGLIEAVEAKINMPDDIVGIYTSKVNPISAMENFWETQVSFNSTDPAHYLARPIHAGKQLGSVGNQSDRVDNKLVDLKSKIEKISREFSSERNLNKKGEDILYQGLMDLIIERPVSKSVELVRKMRIYSRRLFVASKGLSWKLTLKGSAVLFCLAYVKARFEIKPASFEQVVKYLNGYTNVFNKFEIKLNAPYKKEELKKLNKLKRRLEFFKVNIIDALHDEAMLLDKKIVVIGRDVDSARALSSQYERAGAFVMKTNKVSDVVEMVISNGGPMDFLVFDFQTVTERQLRTANEIVSAFPDIPMLVIVEDDSLVEELVGEHEYSLEQDSKIFLDLASKWKVINRGDYENMKLAKIFSFKKNKRFSLVNLERIYSNKKSYLREAIDPYSILEDKKFFLFRDDALESNFVSNIFEDQIMFSSNMGALLPDEELTQAIDMGVDMFVFHFDGSDSNINVFQIGDYLEKIRGVYPYIPVMVIIEKGELIVIERSYYSFENGLRHEEDISKIYMREESEKKVKDFTRDFFEDLIDVSNEALKEQWQNTSYKAGREMAEVSNEGEFQEVVTVSEKATGKVVGIKKKAPHLGTFLKKIDKYGFTDEERQVLIDFIPLDYILDSTLNRAIKDLQEIYDGLFSSLKEEDIKAFLLAANVSFQFGLDKYDMEFFRDFYLGEEGASEDDLIGYINDVFAQWSSEEKVLLIKAVEEYSYFFSKQHTDSAMKSKVNAHDLGGIDMNSIEFDQQDGSGSKIFFDSDILHKFSDIDIQSITPQFISYSSVNTIIQVFK